MNLTFIDLNDGAIFTEAYLREEWETGRETDPESHHESFEVELLEIILATINGRNDLEFISPTNPEEINAYVYALREKIRKQEGGRNS